MTTDNYFLNDPDFTADEARELDDEMLDGIAGGEKWACIRDWSCATQTIKPGPPIV